MPSSPSSHFLNGAVTVYMMFLVHDLAAYILSRDRKLDILHILTGLAWMCVIIRFHRQIDVVCERIFARLENIFMANEHDEEITEGVPENPEVWEKLLRAEEMRKRGRK